MERKEQLLNIFDGMRFNVSKDKLADYVISSVYLYLRNKNLIADGEEEKMAYEISISINREFETQIFPLFDEVDNDIIFELIKLALKNSDVKFDDSSSKELSELTMKLFGDLYGGPIVFDACAGRGNFLFNAIEYSIKKRFVFKDLIGTDVNYQNIQICNMLLKSVAYLKKIEGMPVVKSLNSMIDHFNFPISYAYVFPPLGLKYTLKEKYNPSKLYKDIEFTGRNTAEWIFIDNVLAQNNGSPNCKTIAITSIRALFSNGDKKYRDRLIEDGRLEGIIELPQGAVSFTGVKLAMLIFSNNNRDVKVLDASDFYIKNKRQFKNILDVERVYDSYMASNCLKKSFKELVELNNIQPSSIHIGEPVLKNGVQLSDIAEVFTGSQYTVRNFEDMFSKEATGYRILTSGDIDNGVVDWKKLQSIKYKGIKFDKFAVKKGDVIVASKSSKIKTVVVDIEPKEKILVTGGMIIVRPDSTKLNPVYLKMFIDSKLGQASLRQIQKGSIIMTINSKDLATIKVPLIDIKEQNAKTEEYSLKLTTILSYKREIERLERSLNNLFDEEEGETCGI